LDAVVFSHLMLYVSDDDAEKARKMELLFGALPSQAGVLFVSIIPEPSQDGRAPFFTVRLGITRRLEVKTGKSLIHKVLETEMKAGVKIYVAVYRGISGACRDDGSASARPLAS
jgi:hypothetical protein